MVTITFNKENEAGRTLLAVARALMQSVQDSLITIHETQDEELADIPTERISGLPYTMNERLEALRVAEEDIKAAFMGKPTETKPKSNESSVEML